jgi:hypothetical protein
MSTAIEIRLKMIAARVLESPARKRWEAHFEEIHRRALMIILWRVYCLEIVDQGQRLLTMHEHDFEFVDDSFSHEYGTEQIFYFQCACGETRECEPGDFHEFDD